jgi:membrane protease YdiL (CAAX protease family)
MHALVEERPLEAADAVFVAVACGLVPVASLALTLGAWEDVSRANLSALFGSIMKWTSLGVWAIAVARRHGWSLDELYLGLRGSLIVRRPASTLVAVVAFVMVVNLAVMPRFAAAYEALGLPPFSAPYLAMPASVVGRALAVLCSIAAAGGSEIVYRGYLRVLAERWFRSWWVAALVVSAAFGWAHSFYGLYGTLYTALNGFAFALLARATACLYVVILAHMLLDLMVFLVR